VFEASVDAAAAAAANAHWSHTSASDVSILGTNTLADDFASENGECSSLASAAREKSVFTYEAPKQCAMMMVCAGLAKSGVHGALRDRRARPEEHDDCAEEQRRER
jgi:hypothetical protein